MPKIVSPIVDFKLERFFARFEFAVRHNLYASDIEGYHLAEILELADGQCLSLWQSLTLGYTETAGLPLLRHEIATLYDQVSAGQILCFSGAEEGIYIAMRVLLRPGDHVIVTWPCYQSLAEVARSVGAEVSLLQLRLRSTEAGGWGWGVDLDELRGMMRANTKLVVTNFPHNPTGALLSRQEFAALIEIVREAGCYLFSDEVYRYLEYDASDRLPAAVDVYERALSLGVMSKPFALAGLRIGWLACRDPHLMTEIAAYKDYTTICNSAPAEILALIALRARDRVLDRSLGLIRKNLALVGDFMAGKRKFFQWIPPQAGSIAFPKWLGPEGIDDMTANLVRTQGVLLLPGTLFEYPGNHFRLGLGRFDLAEALAKIESYLKIV